MGEIGFSTSDLDSAHKSLFWRHILSGAYDLKMVLSGNVIGPEIVVMGDQEKAADIACLVANRIPIYEKEKGRWMLRKHREELS